MRQAQDACQGRKDAKLQRQPRLPQPKHQRQWPAQPKHQRQWPAQPKHQRQWLQPELSRVQHYEREIVLLTREVGKDIAKYA